MRYESITRTVLYYAREMARQEHPLIDGVYQPDPVHEFGPRAYWATLDPFTRSQWVRRARVAVDLTIGNYDDAGAQLQRWAGTSADACFCVEEVGLTPEVRYGCCQRCGGVVPKEELS